MARRPAKQSRKTSSPPRSASASRAEVNRLLRMVLDNAAAIEKLREEQHIHFRRMAQLQAELDGVKQLLEKTRNPG